MIYEPHMRLYYKAQYTGEFFFLALSTTVAYTIEQIADDTLQLITVKGSFFENAPERLLTDEKNLSRNEYTTTHFDVVIANADQPEIKTLLFKFKQPLSSDNCKFVFQTFTGLLPVDISVKKRVYFSPGVGNVIEDDVPIDTL